MTTRENKFLSIRPPRYIEDSQLLLRVRMRPEPAIVCAVRIDETNLSAAANI